MSDLAQSFLLSGGIFAVVMLRSYGRRAFDLRALLVPLALIGGFGWSYLRDAPLSSGGDVATYVAALLVGLGFAGAAAAFTGLERDERGRTRTVTGPAFAAVWALAVVVRLAFVWGVTDWGWFRVRVGAAMSAHHVDAQAIAPAFLLWALVMVVARLWILKIRERGLASAPAPTAGPVPVA